MDQTFQLLVAQVNLCSLGELSSVMSFWAFSLITDVQKPHCNCSLSSNSLVKNESVWSLNQKREKNQKNASHLGRQQFPTFTRSTPRVPGQLRAARGVDPSTTFFPISDRRKNKLFDRVWMKNKHDKDLQGTVLWELLVWLIPPVDDNSLPSLSHCPEKWGPFLG